MQINANSSFLKKERVSSFPNKSKKARKYFALTEGNRSCGTGEGKLEGRLAKSAG